MGQSGAQQLAVAADPAPLRLMPLFGMNEHCDAACPGTDGSAPSVEARTRCSSRTAARESAEPGAATGAAGTSQL